MKTEAEMFELSFKRPKGYFQLTERMQWVIDDSLGILDWWGGCAHSKTFCSECLERFNNHYKKHK